MAIFNNWSQSYLALSARFNLVPARFDLVRGLGSSVLIGTSLNLQVSRTGIIFRMNSNVSQFGLLSSL